MDILNLNKSKIKRDILRLYFAHEEKRYYLRELERLLKRPAAYIRRELIKLEKEGLFLSEYSGKERYFWLDCNFFLFKEVRGIVNKTIGIEGRLRKILSQEEGIEEAYIFGSYAKGKLEAESDIDLLLIGPGNNLKARKNIYNLQRMFEREINIIDMDKKEMEKRKKEKDEFFSNIFSGKIIKIK